MSEQRYRHCVVLLLTGIFVCQAYTAACATFFSPTVGAFKTAKGWVRQRLMDNLPLIDIRDEVDVNVINSSLDVDISNQPIEVKVSH